jgi:rod shape-determining protein MreD
MFQTGLMVVMGLFAVVLSVMPIATASAMQWVPSFSLIFLFYWTMHRPDIFPRWLVFFMGLAQDILSNGPLGLWALVYVCTYEGVYLNRLFFIGRVAYSSVFGFTLASTGAAVFAWVLVSIYYWQPLAPLPLITQTFVTILVYPVVAWILDFMNRQLGAEYD